MAEKCQVCGKRLSDFEECDHISDRLALPSAADINSMVSNFVVHRASNIVYLAPFFGIILDLFLPIWSNLFIAFVYVLIASFLINLMELSIASRSFAAVAALQRAFLIDSFFGLRAGTQLVRNLIFRLGSTALAVLLIFNIGTPGNGQGLQNAISNEIQDQIGLDFGVECPNLFLTHVGSRTICEVNYFLALTTPVEIKVKNVFGDVQWEIDFGIFS